MKHSVHICKVPGGWLVQRRTLFQAFLWDWRHYGLAIAIHNLLWQWVHWRDQWVRSG